MALPLPVHHFPIPLKKHAITLPTQRCGGRKEDAEEEREGREAERKMNGVLRFTSLRDFAFSATLR